MPAESLASFPWTSYLQAAAGLVLLFLLSWPILVRARAEAHVDVMWAVAIAGLAAVGAWQGAGWGPRRFFAFVLPAMWAGRLALHLTRRLARQGGDGRYAAMREALGSRHFLAMGPFFLVQGLLAAALALPWWAISSRSEPHWSAWELAGLALWILAWIGETIADAQLDAWRRDPAQRGRTCRAGLWAWSRHPNYFFEWLGWCGVALMAWSAPAGWSGAAAAALLYLLVTRVSGIPFTERQALRSRGDDYRAYQRSVSAFFPLPPR